MTYFFLPSRPESTSCLSDRERQIAVERMNRDSSGDKGTVINKGPVFDILLVLASVLLDWSQILTAHIIAAFCDWRVCLFWQVFVTVLDTHLPCKIYVGGIIYFGLNCALTSIGAFLPTVITTFGYSTSLFISPCNIQFFYHQLQVLQLLSWWLFLPTSSHLWRWYRFHFHQTDVKIEEYLWPSRV